MRKPPWALAVALAAATVATPGLAAAKTESHQSGRAAGRSTRAGAPAGGSLARGGGSTYVTVSAKPAERTAAATTPERDGGTIVDPSAPAGADGPSGATGSGPASGGTSPTTGSTGTTGTTGTTGSTGATGLPSTAASHARILADGLAQAPAGAPAAVRQAIAAGNQLIGKPYVYGGGHASFVSAGYDCSGSVSYALHGADLLASPLDSSELELWGVRGTGRWITVYTNPAHAYVDIAGIRLDTSSAGDPGGLSGPRWRPLLSSNAGYLARHHPGL